MPQSSTAHYDYTSGAYLRPRSRVFHGWWLTNSERAAVSQCPNRLVKKGTMQNALTNVLIMIWRNMRSSFLAMPHLHPCHPRWLCMHVRRQRMHVWRQHMNAQDTTRKNRDNTCMSRDTTCMPRDNAYMCRDNTCVHGDWTCMQVDMYAKCQYACHAQYTTE